MSTKSLGQLTLDMILKTGSYTEPLSKATRQTKSQMKEIEKSATETSDIVQRSFATLGIGISLNEIRKYSDTWTDLNSRVRLAVGPMGDASNVMSELEQIARKTYSSIETSAEGYLSNASALNELGFSTRQQLDFTNALAAGLVASGAKAEQAASVTNALSKAIAEGVLRGDNWNTVFQTGGEVADALARSLGLTRAELDKMARSGALTSETVVKALIDQMEDLQGKADSMATTVGDAFVQLDNAALRVFGTLAEGSNASGLTSAAILKLADNLERVVDVAAIATAVMLGRFTPTVLASGMALAQKTALAIKVNAQLAVMAGVADRASVRIGLLGVALTGVNRSLAFFGGVSGLLVGATAAVSYFALTGSNAKDKVNDLTKALHEMQQPLDGIVSAFKELTIDQQASKVLEMTQAQSEAVKEANREWSKLNSNLFGIKGAFAELTPERVRLIDELGKAREAGEDLTPILQRAGEAAGVPQSKINEWVKLAGGFANAQKEAMTAAGVIARLRDLMAAPKGSSGEVALSPEFQKTAEALTRQIDLFGKTGDAAKLLYEIQSGSLAGKLSETEQKALMALAEKLDLLNKNADAAKKLADEQKQAADTVQAFIENARETSKLLQVQLDGTDKLGQAQQELIKYEAKLAEIRNKETLTALDKEFLAQEANTRAQLEKNVALEAEVKQRRDALRLAEYMGNLQLETSSYQEQYQIQLGLMGLSERQRQIESERLEINRDITRQKQEAFRQLQAGDIDDGQYQDQISALDTHLAERLQLFDNYYTQLSEREGDWSVGAMTAMQNYIENAQDIAGQMEEIFGKMFSGLEDSVLEFVKTGEFSMRDLMAAIAEDVIRMLIRIGIQKMATWAIDKLFGAQAAAGYAVAVTGQASAMNLMAGLNAFASTAAIPIVGPAMAPAAMGAALAVTSPLAAGAIAAATSSLAGMAHSGLDYIPQEGTWLLDKGERVLSPRQNEDLTRFLSAANTGSATANASVKVEIINASGEQVNVRNERRGNGVTAQEVIKIFVGDMAERGPMHKALTQYTTAGNRL
ncbi:tape measure protein [Alishewanella sp. d11]|uniref:tape measure protein n=1 Tax=Alishewanella sp. d11 TaxID=3414030 RepID=UPI003BF79C62